MSECGCDWETGGCKEIARLRAALREIMGLMPEDMYHATENSMAAAIARLALMEKGDRGRAAEKEEVKNSLSQNELYEQALRLVRDCYRGSLRQPTEDQMRAAATKTMKVISRIYSQPRLRSRRPRLGEKG